MTESQLMLIAIAPPTLTVIYYIVHVSMYLANFRMGSIMRRYIDSPIHFLIIAIGGTVSIVSFVSILCYLIINN